MSAKMFKVATPYTETTMPHLEVIQKLHLSNEAKRLLSKLDIYKSLSVGQTKVTRLEDKPV